MENKMEKNMENEMEPGIGDDRDDMEFLQAARP